MVLAEPRSSQLGREPSSPASSNSLFDEITSEDAISELGGSFTDLALSLIPSSPAVPLGSILYSASPALSTTTNANVSVEEDEFAVGTSSIAASVAQDGHEAQVAPRSGENPSGSGEPTITGLGLSVQPDDDTGAQTSLTIPHVLPAHGLTENNYTHIEPPPNTFTINVDPVLHTVSPGEQLRPILGQKEKQLILIGALGQRVLAEKFELEKRLGELQSLISDKEEQLVLIASLGQRVLAQQIELEERALQLNDIENQESIGLGELLDVVQRWESENGRIWAAAHASSIGPHIELPIHEGSDGSDEVHIAVSQYVLSI